MGNQPDRYAKTRKTCYYTYLAMSSVFCLPPMLFVTFREMYGISYTLLGTLVLINFCTQLTIDLIFSFFSRYFNIKKTIRVMPLLTAVGLAVYAIVPTLLPQYAYAGLVVGTVIFSVAAGLCEVLLSPLVAAMPSENPDRDMSRLHSLYAYGVLTVVLISTVFFTLFGRENWRYLTLFLALLPLGSCVMFCISPLPNIDVSNHDDSGKPSGQRLGLALCVMCIFFGSAAENAMTNWISGYVEKVLQVPKTVGDILGLAVFAVLLGAGRTWYAKYGKRIADVLLVSMCGATACYLLAALSGSPVVSLVACALTGLFTAMLWPGTLIWMEEKFPGQGVTAYALMAAGGDLGGSIAPQMLGAITDVAAVSGWAAEMSASTGLSPDQIGMKLGMLIAAAFPLIGIMLLMYMRRYFRRNAQ